MMRYITVFVFLICFSGDLKAQLLESFTARDGLETATNFVKDQIGLTTPVLIGVGTSKGSTVIQDYEVSFSYDLDNGESEVWLYMFVEDEGDENYNIVGVLKPMVINYLARDLSDDFSSQLPFIPSKRVVSNWNNSDELATSIKNDSDYSSYKNNNQDIEPINVVLYVNTVNEQISIDETYWIATFGENEEEEFVCFVHSATGSSTCMEIQGNPNNVELSKSNLISIYPNPAKEHISLDLSNLERSNIKNIIITDSQGKKVSEFNNLSSLSFDVSELAPGIYDLVLFYESDVTVKKFVILK